MVETKGTCKKHGEFILRDKVMHPSIILNMSLMTVRGFMESQLISEAIDQQKEYYGEKVKPYANLH